MFDLIKPTNIHPEGWLRDQLRVQADGLMGNLDKVWRDVRDSRWIGGECEGWERVPYWLDGFIPLAYLLDDRDMIDRAEKYVNAIIDRQQSDGWICPCTVDERADYDVWALFLIGKVLALYCDFTDSEKAENSLYRAFRNLYELITDGSVKLNRWGEFRWFEALIPIDFLYKRHSEQWLIDLARELKKQGADYDSFRDKWVHPMYYHSLDRHIVNIGMMLKTEAVEKALFGESDVSAAEQDAFLARYNGTAVGIYTGDECLAGISNVQGTELCAVVEQMYSLEWLYRVTGKTKWLDQLEKIAFNALPATFTDDMWAHQYVQQVNQIECTRILPECRPYWTTNSSEAHLFGLEPNYGCCTANGGQGFPKLAMNGVLTDGKSLVIPVLMPLSVECEVGGKTLGVKIETEYPFRHSAKIMVSGDGKVKVRVPSWVKKVTLDGREIRKTEYITLASDGGEKTYSLEYGAEPRITARPYEMKCAEWGPLVFAFPLEAKYKMEEYERDGVERKFPYCDYELTSDTPWEYGFASRELAVEYHDGDKYPFSSKNPRVTLKARLAPIEWGYATGYDNIAAPIPFSRKAIGETEEKMLVPYGCAKLRVTEMPMCRRTK